LIYPLALQHKDQEVLLMGCLGITQQLINFRFLKTVLGHNMLVVYRT
jgi:hypothetical protein